jgi:hypothetical protein
MDRNEYKEERAPPWRVGLSSGGMFGFEAKGLKTTGGENPSHSDDSRLT